MTTPKQSPKLADDVAAMVETGSPPVVTVTLDGEKYVPAAMLTRQAEQIEALRAESDVSDALLADAKARAEAAEKRNAELEAFVKLCADGFFIADDELQGAAMATLKEHGQ